MHTSAPQLRRRLSLASFGLILTLGHMAGPVSLSQPVSSAAEPTAAVVSGRVFDDRNGNGIADHGERGIGGVTVSDGVTLVQTAPDGSYRLEIDPGRRIADNVFITQPSGYAVATNAQMVPQFFRGLGRLADGDVRTGVDFALTRDPQSRRDRFTFANMSDVEVNGQLSQQIREVSSTKSDLAFIQISGDLTGNASDAQFQQYLAATAESDVPVWPAVGNHDYFYAGGGTTYAEIIDNYRRHLGPEWYSFEYGNRHFLVLENNVELGRESRAQFDEQLNWARRDLELNMDDDEHLVVVMHQPMNVPFTDRSDYDVYADLLERYGAELILVGHAHSNDAEPNSNFVSTAKHVQTTSSSYTIDSSPRGFRYINMQADSYENPFRVYGIDKMLTITSPAPGSSVPRTGFPGIQVNAYDTNDPATRVTFRVDDGPWRPMRSSGEYTWHTDRVPSVGEHRVEVRATDASGEIWTESAQFTLTDEPAITPVAGENWAQHHGDAGHTGAAGDTIGADPRLAWSYRTDGTFLAGSPVIVEGVVYAGTRDDNGEGNARVHAVDMETGEELWSREMPVSVHATVAVADGTVFVPTIHAEVFALDAETGEQLWQRAPDDTVPEPYNPRAFSYNGVTVVDDLVLWQYRSTFGDAAEGLLVALDSTTGDVVWESVLPQPWPSDAAPAVDAGRVFATGTNRVFAYDLETGRPLWDKQVQTDVHQDAGIAAADGRVFVGAAIGWGSGMVALDAATGEELWTANSGWPSLDHRSPATVAIADGIVYMANQSGAVVALDAASGTRTWGTWLLDPYRGGGIHSSPAVTGNTVFVRSNNGRFYALDRSTGQVLWEHMIGTMVAAGPAMSGNTVVVGAWDGNLYAYTGGGDAPNDAPNAGPR